MEYRKFGNNIVIRIDKGEEILAKIKEVALSENINLARASKIGRASCRERV